MVKKKILIVDDEPDIIRTTALALRLEGFQIIAAVNGQEALEKARRDGPDIIILDVVLPKISGDDVVNILRRDERCRDIPIIIISALTQKCDEELINKTGAEFYMKKPFDLDQLSGKIKELLAR